MTEVLEPGQRTEETRRRRSIPFIPVVMDGVSLQYLLQGLVLEGRELSRELSSLLINTTNSLV